MHVDEFFELSDEEVFAYATDNSTTDDDEYVNDQDSAQPPRASGRQLSTPYEKESDASRQLDEDEDANGWGVSKTDYYNADQIETEADALEEEAEALRLQKKQLQKMTDADFGLDEAEWIDLESGTDAVSQGRGGIIREELPQLEIADDVSPEERTKILYARYPEFKHLAQEYITLQAVHEDLQAKMVEANAIQSYLRVDMQEDSASIVTLKHNSLSAYLGAICMYFALLTAPGHEQISKPKAVNPNELHDHPIMEVLLACRNTWKKLEHVTEPDLTLAAAGETPAQNGNSALSPSDKIEATPIPAPEIVKRKRKSKAQKAHEVAVAQARAERVARIQRAEEDLKTLYQKPSTSLGRTPNKARQSNDELKVDDDSDFGEETHLNEYDAEDKAKRKKSLQFYTSQIAQKASKRGAASRAAGGDDDIPYKERLKDRQERLNREAEKRGKKGRDTATLATGMDESSGDEDHTIDTSAAAQTNNTNEYYDELISRPAALKAARKAQKTAAYQAKLAAEAEASGDRVVAVEQIGADGKRAIGYTIEKNKGLAPHRGRDVRNPRVKKRKKFEEKKKK